MCRTGGPRGIPWIDGERANARAKGDCPIDAGISGPPLNSLEMTGRAATHVRHVADPRCVLHVRAAEALIPMRDEARRAGIDLDVVSGFRDFNRQAAIWSGKFNGSRPLLDARGAEINRADLYESALIDAILSWSALPGASRHHWGSEIDVIDTAALPAGARPQLTPAQFAPGGCFERLNGWLDSNMRRFGFFRPYATFHGGVRPEPWHLSYAAVSVPALDALSLDVLREALEGADLPGKQTVLARLPQLYERYVLAVDGA
jgi:LAS superfamily LD-carboxypeptidase LdcB